MEIKIEIAFEQLIQLVKQLPAKQLSKLKSTLDTESKSKDSAFDIKSFLLKAPTFDKNQIKQISQTRKTINQWRTK